MIVELTITFTVGTASGLFAAYLWNRRKRTLKKQLEGFDNEEELVGKLRDSDAEYNRWYMESVLSVLFLICVANIANTVVAFVRLLPAYPAETFIRLICWSCGAIICIQEIARSRNIRFHERFAESLNKKRQKVKSKLSDFG